MKLLQKLELRDNKSRIWYISKIIKNKMHIKYHKISLRYLRIFVGYFLKEIIMMFLIIFELLLCFSTFDNNKTDLMVFSTALSVNSLS